MGLIRWILSKERIARYVAKALPEDVIAHNLTDEVVRSSGPYKAVENLRKELEARLGQVNGELIGAREVNVAYEKTIRELDGYKQEFLTTNQNLNEQLRNKESSLGKFTEDLEQAIGVEIELISDNERLRDAVEAQKEEIEGLSKRTEEFEGRYYRLIRDVSYHLRQTRKRAVLLEERFDSELEKVGKSLGEKYRKDLEVYFAASERVIEGNQTRADNAERQQVFLQGALIRLEREMARTLEGYVSFFYRTFGTSSSLTKVVGIFLNNDGKPVYATPKFLEVGGISESGLNRFNVPTFFLPSPEHKGGIKIRYRDHIDKEHVAKINSTEIKDRDGENIGTYVQIDESFGDWLGRTTHLRRSGFGIVDLFSREPNPGGKKSEGTQPAT